MFSSMLSLLGSLRRGNFVTNSLRFRSSAPASLSRLPSVTGNRQTWTWSGWVKRGALGIDGTLFGSGDLGLAGQNVFNFRFKSTDDIRCVQTNSSGAATIQFDTTAVFRDPSAWYHVVLAVDTTQAISTNGVRLWVNGLQQSGTFAAYTQSTNCSVNSTGFTNYIGRWGIVSPTNYFDGYLTEVNFIDGQALTPSSFGQIESTTGVWSPKQYVGTYGANGFYLKFSDASAATAAAIGKDSSGNGNNWTPSGISVTAGVTYDSMIDVPVNYSDSGNGRGNYAVLNPLVYTDLSTISFGNLNVSLGNSATGRLAWSTIGVNSDKWYVEFTFSSVTNTGQYCGIIPEENTTLIRNSGNTYVGALSGEYGYGRLIGTYPSNASTYISGVTANTGTTTPALNDVVGMAFDATAGVLQVYLNGVLQSISGFTGIPNKRYFFACSGANSSYITNFGQRPFAYTPPAGFRALNTNNLPTPSIVNGANFMAATTYTGNAAARSLSNAVNNVSFQPDLVWIKSRTPGATSHALFDSVRGTTKYLSSDTTAAETTLAQSLTAFGANGFSLGTDTTLVNANANSYIAWQWKAGDSTVTNTAGSITSQVNANTTAGFSIVNYTGTGVNATVGHGLGVAPKMIITKDRDTVINWVVYHESMGGTSFVRLNTTDPKITDAVIYNGTPSSTVFNIGIGIGINTATKRMVSYCFAEIAGFSKFGTYTGNGSADGPFVFCGFRPRFVIVKRTDATGDWRLWDSARDTYNAAPNVLFSNLSNVEASSAASPIDVLSNGFKLRGTGGDPNTTGGTYIFAAFAEVPTKYALAR